MARHQFTQEERRRGFVTLWRRARGNQKSMKARQAAHVLKRIVGAYAAQAGCPAGRKYFADEWR
jgi:hypothetical protein